MWGPNIPFRFYPNNGKSYWVFVLYGKYKIRYLPFTGGISVCPREGQCWPIRWERNLGMISNCLLVIRVFHLFHLFHWFTSLIRVIAVYLWCPCSSTAQLVLWYWTWCLHSVWYRQSGGERERETLLIPRGNCSLCRCSSLKKQSWYFIYKCGTVI